MSDRLYQDLRSSIMTLTLKPGDMISINEIADNLGISRSPVRDALLKLEKEGLVDIMPQKGTCVSRIDTVRMHEERFLRESLEKPALSLFIAKTGVSDVPHLESILARQKKSMEDKDSLAFLDRDDEFHSVFFAGAGKQMCWEIISSMSGHYRRVRVLILRNPGVMENLYAQHVAILERIAAEDSKGAVELITSHLTRLLTEEDELVAEFPDYFLKRRNGL